MKEKKQEKKEIMSLIVRSAFGNYQVGDCITDEKEVEEILSLPYRSSVIKTLTKESRK